MDVEELVSVERKRQGDHVHLQLTGEMTIYVAQLLKQEFLSTLVDCQSLDINLANVSEIDTAGLQQLYLLKREALANKKTFTVSAHSPATQEVLTLCGMQDQFPESPVGKKISARKKTTQTRQKAKG